MSEISKTREKKKNREKRRQVARELSTRILLRLTYKIYLDISGNVRLLFLPLFPSNAMSSACPRRSIFDDMLICLACAANISLALAYTHIGTDVVGPTISSAANLNKATSALWLSHSRPAFLMYRDNSVNSVNPWRNWRRDFPCGSFRLKAEICDGKGRRKGVCRLRRYCSWSSKITDDEWTDYFNVDWWKRMTCRDTHTSEMYGTKSAMYIAFLPAGFSHLFVPRILITNIWTIGSCFW